MCSVTTDPQRVTVVLHQRYSCNSAQFIFFIKLCRTKADMSTVQVKHSESKKFSKKQNCMASPRGLQYFRGVEKCKCIRSDYSSIRLLRSGGNMRLWQRLQGNAVYDEHRNTRPCCILCNESLSYFPEVAVQQSRKHI